MARKTTSDPDPRYTQPDESEPAQERGERIDTGRSIARGGKSTGDVPGATETPPTKEPDDAE